MGMASPTWKVKGLRGVPSVPNVSAGKFERFLMVGWLVGWGLKCSKMQRSLSLLALINGT